MSHLTNEKATSGEVAFVEQSHTDFTKNPAKAQAINPVYAALEAALLLVERGIPCFPCNEGKKPTCPHGFKDATANADNLRVLWKQYPGTLIGIPTGEVSGFDVLDVDPRHDGDKWLDANAGNIPPTRTNITRSGGWHLLFLHRAGMRNSAGKIAPGVDVRADGGYIIWWCAAGLAVVDDAPLADWPDWIVQELLPPPHTRTMPQMPTVPCGRYVQAALRNAMHRVASAPEGTRNETLNREAYSLGRLIESAQLSPHQIAATLSHAALAAGLDHKEAVATIASALRARGV